MREKNKKLTKFELELMNALWELRAASVREIQEHLPEKRRPAYTTVQTIVYRLEEKGAVRRAKKIGNAHVFEPVITQKSAYRRLVDELLDMFGGSAQPLMSHLVEAGKLSLADVRTLEAELARVEAGEEEAAAANKQPRVARSVKDAAGGKGRRT